MAETFYPTGYPFDERDAGDPGDPGDAGDPGLPTPDGWLTAWTRRADVDPLPAAATEADREARASAVIRAACVRAALLGAGAGLVTTAAVALAVETGGAGIAVAVPLAALAAGAEVAGRAAVHIEMARSLGDSLGVPFNRENPGEARRLRSLARTAAPPVSTEAGRALVAELLVAGSEGAAEVMGKVLSGRGAAGLGTLLPVAGVITASVSGWFATRRLGEAVRAELLRLRPLRRVLETGHHRWSEHRDLLVEGVWFVLSAPAPLDHESAAVVANLLRDCDPLTRAATLARLTDDERAWLSRLSDLPRGLHGSLLEVLEAAGIVVGTPAPSRRVLRRAAEALGNAPAVRPALRAVA